MAIKLIRQAEPATDPNRCQLYEDVADNKPKVKSSTGNVTDLEEKSSLPVFGSNYKSASNSTAVTTTATTYSTVLTLTTDDLPVGEYIVGFFYNWGYGNTSYNFMSRIEIDSSDVIMIHEQEPKDTGTDVRQIGSGSIPVSMTAGVHQIRLQFRSQRSGDEARMRNMSMYIWRTA